MGPIASAAWLPGTASATLPVATAEENASQPGSEIVVTARRRAEAPQRVPISLSIVEGKAIEALDLRNTTDLSGRSPNLLSPANAVAISTPTFFIRGVGEGDHNWNDENGVAFFIDDVYIQSPSAAWLDLTDMDRVEVLRGPQGTLYGRNAVSGAIKFVPRLPDPSGISAYGETTLGQGGRVDVKAGANLPIDGGRAAIRINLFDVRSNGSLTEVDGANHAVNDRLARFHHSGARLATLWRPRDGLEFELNGDVERQDDGMYVATPIVPEQPFDDVLSKSGTVDFDPLYGPNRVALEPLTAGGDSGLIGGGLVFKVRVGTPLGRLSSISAWRDYDGHFVSQLGGRSTPSTAFGVTLYGNVNTVYEKVSQLTQELQLTGKWRSLVDYAAGVFVFRSRWRESEYGSTNGIPANLSPFLIPGQTQPFGGSYNDIDQTTNSFALYASTDWHVAPALTLSAGARQTWDHKDLFFETLFEDHLHDYPGFPLTTSKSWRRFTPRLGADWKPSGQIMLYASWAKGYKVGNVEGARSSDPTTAGHWLGPEIATTWEAGIKADALGDRLHANLDAFTSLNTGRTDLVSPDRVASATVRLRGIEAEARLEVTPDLTLHGAAGLLWAKYRHLSANHPVLRPDASGHAPGYSADPPMSPRYTVSADAHYRAPLGSAGSVVGDVSAVAVAKHFHPLGLNNFDSEIVRPYTVVDASVGWVSANNRVRVTLGAHNLLDKLYWTSGMFGSIPEFAGRYYADRRRLYVELRYTR
jgi:iron complex outermembrane receptor protein